MKVKSVTAFTKLSSTRVCCVGWFCKHPRYWNSRENTSLQPRETHLTETIHGHTNTRASIGKLPERKTTEKQLKRRNRQHRQ